jgi:hypothetical protein
MFAAPDRNKSKAKTRGPGVANPLLSQSLVEIGDQILRWNHAILSAFFAKSEAFPAGQASTISARISQRKSFLYPHFSFSLSRETKAECRRRHFQSPSQRFLNFTALHTDGLEWQQSSNRESHISTPNGPQFIQRQASQAKVSDLVFFSVLSIWRCLFFGTFFPEHIWNVHLTYSWCLSCRQCRSYWRKG